MKILSLEANKIFSLGQIDLNFEDRGLLLVNGYSHDDKNANGAGKSSVANKAIIWTLYGKTPGKIRADDVVNKYTDGKQATGAVNFIGVDQKTYRVLRRRNPNLLKLFTIEDYQSYWTDISSKTTDATQKDIDHLLGRDFNTFCHTDFFGQGRKNAFFELTPKEQQDILEEILPIDRLQEWADRAKLKAKEILAKINTLKLEQQRMLGELDANIHQRDFLQSQFDMWQNAQAEKIKKATLATQFHRDLHSKLKFLEDDLNTYQEGKVTWATYKKSFTIIPLDKDCTQCGQPLPEERLKELIVQQNKAKAEVESAEKAVALYDKMIDTAQASKLQIVTKLKDIILEDVIELRSQTNPYWESLNDTCTRIFKNRENSSIIGRKVTTLEKELGRLQFWERVYSKDLKTILFDQACPYLEQQANQYLRELNNGQLKISVSTKKQLKKEIKEEFSVNVKSDNGGNSFHLLSGGEQQLSSFAIGLALSDLATTQTSGSSSFLILDEPFTGLSPYNCENVVNFLTTKLGEKKSTILLISNEDDLKSLIPNQIFVEKKDGITTCRT